MSVNPALTVKRRTRHRETKDYASFLRRALRAFQRRVSDTGDIESLAVMMEVSREMDQAIAEAVRGLKDRGYSWADIASRLGVTRQACQQRYGR